MSLVVGIFTSRGIKSHEADEGKSAKLNKTIYSQNPDENFEDSLQNVNTHAQIPRHKQTNKQTKNIRTRTQTPSLPTWRLHVQMQHSISIDFHMALVFTNVTQCQSDWMRAFGSSSKYLWVYDVLSSSRKQRVLQFLRPWSSLKAGLWICLEK